MSKEKNLTFERSLDLSDNIYWIDTYGHQLFSGPTYRYFSGPAIDRLHEFEKLELEPEEIKHLRSENNLLADTNENLSTQYLRLLGDRDALKNEVEMANEKIEYWKTENSRLQDENEQLKDDLDIFRHGVRSDEKLIKNLQTRLENQANTIRELEKENEQLNCFYELYKSTTDELIIVCRSLMNELKALKEKENE